MPRVSIELPASLTYSTEIPVRIGDINYGGHLGNDAVLSLVHEARVRFLASHGYTEKDIEGLGIFMSDAAVVYRSEAFHGDVLRVDVGAGDPFRTGCTLFYLLTNTQTGREVARVSTGIVFVDHDMKKMRQAPPAFLVKMGLG